MFLSDPDKNYTTQYRLELSYQQKRQDKAIMAYFGTMSDIKATLAENLEYQAPARSRIKSSNALAEPNCGVSTLRRKPRSAKSMQRLRPSCLIIAILFRSGLRTRKRPIWLRLWLSPQTIGQVCERSIKRMKICRWGTRSLWRLRQESWGVGWETRYREKRVGYGRWFQVGASRAQCYGQWQINRA